MSRLASLQAATSLSDLARLLEYKPSALSYILFKLSPKYHTFEIPKRQGGTRIIKAPTKELKLLQQKLSLFLQDCLDEINAKKQRKDNIAHGFKRKRSIITNAQQHRHRRHVFNIDLEAFFPSINFGRVRGFFINDWNFVLEDAVATVIAQIACTENALPQGSPCSPVISNLIAHVLDMHLVRLVSSVGCTYSRYADDLTFSTNKKQFPAEIATPDPADPHRWLPGGPLLYHIHHAGFRVNPAKTHMQYRQSRQIVTGLVVNEKINIRPEYRHEVRAMVHRLFRTGKFTVYGPVEKNGVVTMQHQDGTLNELHGRLGFIDSVDQHNKKHAAASERERFEKKERVYRQFLIYKDFYTATRPVILCEGVTDNIYLECAIRRLADQLPALADFASDGKITLKVRLYDYPQSSTGRILKLDDGGSGTLASFIATYKRETDKFEAPGQQHPVIILYDADEGASTIRNVIKQTKGTRVVGNEPYVHVVRNLYAMPTPPLPGVQQSKIEDFFDAVTKATVVHGKTFADRNKFDINQHYGKRRFAEEVVKARVATIDFSGFQTLLTVLSDIINHHAAAVSGVAAQAP